MRIAVFGSGGIAARHLQVLTSLTGVEIVGHVTRLPEHAAAMAARWGGKAFTDHRRLLESIAVDAVFICAPPFAHGDLERSLIERRIPFMVEKPLDADCATAESLAPLIREAGIPAGVAYHWRAMDTIGPVRELIVRHPVRMVLGSWLSSTPSPPWWRRETESGGQIVEQTTHLFDLARSLLGEGTPLSAAATRHPRERYPDMDVSDVSIATLRFQNGALGQFAATCLLPTGGDVSLRLFGDEMLITITQERVEILDSEGTRTIERRNDPFLDEDRAFLRAAAERDPSLLYCDYEDALKTHRLCCALRRMSRHTEHAES